MEKEPVIISLTSFPARIHRLWIVVECLLRQTYSIKRIILWLSENQFPKKSCIPQSLTNLISDKFEIRLVSGDIRSHKKYYYAFNEFPSSLVMLVDDDIFYPSTMLDELYRDRNKYGGEGVVVGRWGNVIAHDERGGLLPYLKWRPVENENEDNQFFGSGGGTLLRAENLYEDCLNIELARKLAPLADDVWLNAMCRLKGLRIHIKRQQILPVLNRNPCNLSKENNGENNMNDVQINAVQDYYLKTVGRKVF